MANQYKNKVVYNGTTLIDLSQDTVTSASHILKGYVGHLADGTQVTGTAESGSGEQVTETVVAEQTVTPESDYTRLTIVEPLVSGTKYIYTVNSVETTGIAFDYYGSVVLGNPSNYADGTGMMLESVNNRIYLDTKLRTPFTVKIEKVVSEGGSSAILITKTITANGTYDAINDSADGYSSVTVNVSSGGSGLQIENVIPEQTINCTIAIGQAYANFIQTYIETPIAETYYLVTLDNVEYVAKAYNINASLICIGDIRVQQGSEYVEFPFGIMKEDIFYLVVKESGECTLKVDKILSW